LPLFKRDNRIIHHIHIPKCGGTSVKHLLESEGWEKINIPLAKGDQEIEDYYSNVVDPVRIGISEDGNLYTDHEHREIWGAWPVEVEMQFAIIRNPYGRMHSHIKQYMAHRPWHQEAIERAKSNNLQVLCPVSVLEKLLAFIQPGYFDDSHEDYPPFGGQGDEDNHYRRQVDFLGNSTACVKLEQGIDTLLNLLKENNIVSKGAVFPHINSHDVPLAIPWNEPEYSSCHETFKKLYHDDFKILRYNIIEGKENWNGAIE